MPQEWEARYQAGESGRSMGGRQAAQPLLRPMTADCLAHPNERKAVAVVRAGSFTPVVPEEDHPPMRPAWHPPAPLTVQDTQMDMARHEPKPNPFSPPPVHMGQVRMPTWDALPPQTPVIQPLPPSQSEEPPVVAQEPPQPMADIEQLQWKQPAVEEPVELREELPLRHRRTFYEQSEPSADQISVESSYPVPQARPVEEEDDEDDEAIPSRLMPTPVTVSTTDMMNPQKKRGGRIVLWAAVVCLVSAGVVYMTGIADRLLTGWGVPTWSVVWAELQGSPDTSASDALGQEAVPVVTVEAAPALPGAITSEDGGIHPAGQKPLPALNMLEVKPAVADAPITLVFTAKGNEAITDVRLMKDGAEFISVTSVSSAMGEDRVWEMTTVFATPYTGEVTAYLRDEDGTWVDSGLRCTVTVK